jgi:Ca2+-binding EF-hand superfamily protein
MAEEQKTISYDFTFEQKKNLGPEEQTAMIRAFKNYDLNKDGTMDEKEFKNILIDLGQRKITDAEVKSILDSHDTNRDGVISW